MDDKIFEAYKKNVWERIAKEDKSVIPGAWWETVIAHYHRLGYSEAEAVRVILETMRK